MRVVGGVAVYALIFLVGVAPLVVAPIVPTIDFYNHIARYFVLANVASDPFLAENYAANWSLLPNIGLDVIATGLMKILPPQVVPKVIAIAILATQYTGLLFFGWRLTGWLSPLRAVLSLPLLYSFIFTWGFANFLFGVGLVFWAAGWWLAMRRRPILAVPVACLLSMLIFITHGFAFALYGMLLFSLELGFMLFSKGSVREFATKVAMLLAQAIVPAALFVASATAKSETGVTNTDESIRLLAANGGLLDRIGLEIGHRLETMARVAEGPTLGFDLVTFGLTLAILVAMLVNRRTTFVRIAWPALAILALLALIIPPHMFGVGYISDRIPLFFAMVALAALVADPTVERLTSPYLLSLSALVIVRLGYIGMDWQAYRPDVAAFERIARQIPPGQLVKTVTVGQRRGHAPGARCEMFGPLLTTLHRQATPLFANVSQQPLVLTGRLRAAVAALPSGRGAPEGDRSHESQVITAALNHFDYVLICDGERLPAPFPGRIVAKDGRFVLLQR